MSVMIFEKNKIDIDMSNITITATDTLADDAGQQFVDLLRNRRNDNGWGTAGSADANNTQLDIDMVDEYTITDLLLVNHNLKAYTLKYWNGSTYVDFSTPIAETTNTATTTRHTFTEVQTSALRLIITGTMTANQDKLMSQFIVTKRIGTFASQPAVKKPKQEKGRKVRPMLSGRKNITRAIGTFSCTLSFPKNKSSADHALLERMFDSINGFVVWLCGGSTSDFPYQVQGFRLKDVYLMSCANDLDTEWNNGRFNDGQAVEVQLVESRA